MFHPQTYLPALIAQLRRNFGPRLRYVGLQGSYLRGEATEDSDLDVMVVLSRLSARISSWLIWEMASRLDITSAPS